MVVTSSVRNSTFCYRRVVRTCGERNTSGLLLLKSVLCRKPEGSLPRKCTPGRIVTVLGPVGGRLLYIEKGYSARISRVMLRFPVLTSCYCLGLTKSPRGGGDSVAVFTARKRICGPRGLPVLGSKSVLLGKRARVPTYRRVLSVGNKGCRCLGPNSISVPGRKSRRDCVVCRGNMFA